MSRARLCLLHALLLLLLLAFAFPGFFLRGEVLAPGDLLFTIPPWSEYAPTGFTEPQNALMPDVITAFYPYYAATSAALAEDAWPLWQPLEYAGMPLLANFQSAVLYPPRLLHVLFDMHLANSLYILLKLWLAGMTAFLCALGLGMAPWPARFFSVAWMLSSYNLIWAYWPLPDVAAWLPLVFLGAEWLVQGRYRRGLLTLSLGGTLLLLAGHPETAFAMALAVGFYFFVRLALEWWAGMRPATEGSTESQQRATGALADTSPLPWLRQPWIPIGLAAGAWALALAVCMAQLLPFLEYLLHSYTYAHRTETWGSTAFPPSAIASFWIPRFFGTMADGNYFGILDSNRYMMAYPGMAVWMGCFALLATRDLSPLWRRRVIALLVAVAWGLLLSFEVPPFDLVHDLPFFSAMFYTYHATFVFFALPLLGAMGLQHWFTHPRTWRSLLIIGAACAVVVLLLWVIYSFFASLTGRMGIHPYMHAQLLAGGVLAGLAFLILAVRVIIRGPAQRELRPSGGTGSVGGFAMGVMTALLAADLLYSARGMNPTMPADEVFPPTALTEYLRELPQPVRIGIAEAYIPSGLFAPYLIEEWLAYDGIYPERMVYFQETLGQEIWRNMEPVCSKEYYLHLKGAEPVFPLEEEPERFELVTELNGIEVYRNLPAWPRARLVPGAELLPTRDALYTRMLEEGYDPATAVVALDTPALRAQAPPPGVALDPGAARVTRHESTRVDVAVEVAQDAVLVLSDAWYPGWKAYVDGERAEIFPAYDVFRGVLVPEGAQVVEFHYRPWSFYAGLLVSVLALLGSGVYCAARGWKRFRQGA